MSTIQELPQSEYEACALEMCGPLWARDFSHIRNALLIFGRNLLDATDVICFVDQFPNANFVFIKTDGQLGKEPHTALFGIRDDVIGQTQLVAHFLTLVAPYIEKYASDEIAIWVHHTARHLLYEIMCNRPFVQLKTSADYYSYVQEVPSELELTEDSEVTKEFNVTELRQSDINTLVDVWGSKSVSPGDHYARFSRNISKLPTIALRYKSTGELVGSCMIDAMGCALHLWVADRFRRKGLALVVMKLLSKKAAEQGLQPCAFVHVTNEASQGVGNRMSSNQNKYPVKCIVFKCAPNVMTPRL